MLAIPLDKLAFIIVKARQYDAEVPTTDPASGSNPADDGARDVLLTAMRTKTVLGARAREIDFENRVWNIPAGRPGLKRPGDFRVPLSDAAISVLRAMEIDPAVEPARYLFPGSKPGRPLTNILKYLKDDMRQPAYTVHGFRSTFRDWIGDRTNFPSNLGEFAVAHTLPSKVAAAYRRRDAFDKRRRLMDAWTSFCYAPARAGKVVPLRAG